MKEVLDKITAYNLFNYLVPGVLFAVALESLTSYSITQDNLVVGAFVYYFIGLVISRFGSIMVEPVLKKILFVEFVPYADFVVASKNDPKIELLSQDNNMYRTFVSMFVLLILAKEYDALSRIYPILHEQSVTIAVVLLLLMFLFSYRKQTKYITDRIKATKI